MIPSDWLDLATRRLQGQVRQTPLSYDSELDVYLKWENRQVTGSFKIRGALNKVLSLEPWEQQRGLVTASAGNHGQGVAVAGRLVGAPVTVFASDHAVPAKVEAMRSLGAEVKLIPGGYEEAERIAQTYAAEKNATWVSPYNDGQVIAGHATVGLEILQQLAPQRPSTVLVPVGGGGLIAGIGVAMASANGSTTNSGAAVDADHPHPRVIGVQSVASPFFYALYTHGSQYGVVELESLADGLAGAVEEGSITIPLVRRYVEDFVLVTEDQIARAIAYAWQKHGEMIEGSAAVGIAAVMSGVINIYHSDEGPLVILVSGGNIQPETHARVCGNHRAASPPG
jgi:threonine dehydratase